MIIYLSDAQRSALECADFEDAPTVARCWSAWDKSKLIFRPEDQQELHSELSDLGNSEDAYAQENSSCDPSGSMKANRAAKSLAVLGREIMQA